jgi:hypothetical protein
LLAAKLVKDLANRRQSGFGTNSQTQLAQGAGVKQQTGIAATLAQFGDEVQSLHEWPLALNK